MDALALLCNLYGDGPATLKRLRVHGVLRIEDLEATPTGELATVLALTPATARRFMKEASALRKRVHDPEEAARPSAPAPSVKRAPRNVVRGKQAILQDAARRWDEFAPTPIPATAREVTAALARVPARVGATPLAEADLDAATHAALAEAGVKSLEELAAADSEELAETSRLGLSQVLFAQGVARRKGRETSPVAEVSRAAPEDEQLAVHVLTPPSRADARFSPSERPPAEWLTAGSEPARELPSEPRDDGAGPFA